MDRAAHVRKQLERLLSDPAFAGANRRSRLLRYLVEAELAHRGESLKESVIATDVFDRAADYDPQVDSVVRVEIGRLRARLAEYYSAAAPDEPRIEIPKGTYRPVFVLRETEPETPAVPLADAAAPRTPRPKWQYPAAGIAAVICVVAALAVWRMRVPPPANPQSIAVLPFLNLSGNAADEYLGDGVTDELTEELAEFSDLRVVARTSAFQYKGKSADVREIGRNLHVGAVLEGSVARRDGQLHVIAQLIRTSDGYHLWSRIYDARLAELPALETAIAHAARSKLDPSSAPAAPEMATARDPEAHDLYIRAVYELNRRTEASTRQALDLARQASQKDRSFAQPYILMAAAESQLNTLLAREPGDAARLAWKDVANALALDPENSAAHAQKAILVYMDQWDWPQAEREFRLALANGSHGSAENLYGWCLITRGRFAEARRHLQSAAELDPLSLGPQLNQVEELFMERQYAEARSEAEQILRTAPANPIALTLALYIAFWQRDCSTATAISHKLFEIYPRSPQMGLGTLAADNACGHSNQAQSRERLFAMMRKPPAGYISPYTMAASLTLADAPEAAMSYLQKSAELREPALMMLGVDRAFEPLHQDARFIALERRIGVLE